MTTWPVRPELKRRGKKREHTFPDGEVRVGYDIVRVNDDGTESHVGFATQMFHFGKASGWIVWDSDGQLLIGAGDSTKIGKGLDDCLFMLACKTDQG